MAAPNRWRRNVPDPVKVVPKASLPRTARENPSKVFRGYFKVFRIIKCRFRQRIYTVQENLQFIRENDFSIGKHLKSTMKNAIIANGYCRIYINPFISTVAFNICCPRDCVSRPNGGTAGAPLKPLRDDSALRTLSSLRGLRGTPEVPPLCRETSVSRTANVGTLECWNLMSPVIKAPGFFVYIDERVK